MITIKYPKDFDKVEDQRVRQWLKEMSSYIFDREDDMEMWGPEDCGWLIVLSETADISNLNCGIDVINSLYDIEYWECTDYNGELDLWLATVILGNEFGMVFAVPGDLLKGSPLLDIFKQCLS